MREENNPARNEEEDETDLYIRHGIRNWEEDGKGRGKQSQAASHCLCTVPLPGGRALLKTFAKQAFVLFLLPAAPSLPLPPSPSLPRSPSVLRRPYRGCVIITLRRAFTCVTLCRIWPPPALPLLRGVVLSWPCVYRLKQADREREREKGIKICIQFPNARTMLEELNSFWFDARPSDVRSDKHVFSIWRGGRW